MAPPIRRQVDKPKTKAMPAVRHKPSLTGRDPHNDHDHGAPDGYIKVFPQLLSSGTPQPPVLYAIIGTWFEADVIEATVKNCFANGCTKVWIADNASPDDTVSIALKAGAIVGREYATKFYDEGLRLLIMNDVMKQTTEHEKLPNLWWLSLDADEFPCGPNGERVIDYLYKLDTRINCVGANAIDLYPTTEPHYVPNTHPADCMEQGLRRKSARGVFCDRGHWKHPLLRYDYGVYNIAQSRGSHVPFVVSPQGKPSFVPKEPESELVIFHAPIRTREQTFKRLEILCSKNPALGGLHRSAADDKHIRANGAIKRWRSLEHVYAGRWDQVELPHSQIYGRDVTGIALFPWRRLMPAVQNFPRWYNLDGAPTRLALPLV